MAFDLLKAFFPATPAGPPRLRREAVRSAKDSLEIQRKLYLETQFTNLKNRDPQFNANSFLKRVRNTVLKVKTAFHSHDISTVWPLMTDGMHERLNVQINFQKAGGYRESLECIQIVDCRICQIDSDGHFDAIHVHIAGDGVQCGSTAVPGALRSGVGARCGISRRTASSAAAPPCRAPSGVALAPGATLTGNKHVLSGPRGRVFKEIWSFLRRPGTKTSGLKEGLCPNCGASVRLTDRMKCGTCGSIVNSGQHDWVLFKLNGVCEWKARDSARQVPGLNTMRQQDPGFCAEFLEDRSAVVFWRWREALSGGDTAALVRFASQEFLGKLSRELQGNRVYCRDVVINSARLIDVEINPDRDRVYVLVRWSGTSYRVRQGTSPFYMGPGVRTHVLALERDHGVQTDAGQGLSSTHCAGCGAPESESTSGTCMYCGTPFTDGKRHWVLTDIMLYYDWASKRKRAPRPLWLPMDFRCVSEIEPSIVMAWLVKVMFADKRAGPKETALIETFGRARGFLHNRIAHLIQAERRGELDLPAPRNQKEALGCLRVLVWMALADGRVTKEESDLLLAFASRFKISPARVSELVKSETSPLQKRLQRKKRAVSK